MNQTVDNAALREYVVRLGDDALVLGQRLSEWCSRGPFLEEDLALTNVSLDIIGRARMFYTYAAELGDDFTCEDDFAFKRDCREFTNLLINELPRGDFAFTQARLYLLDEFNLLFLERLGDSTDETLAGIAAKAIKETRYHLRRSRDWMLRLGDGTAGSNERTQKAVDELWGFTPELFEMDEIESSLHATGVAVDRGALVADWNASVSSTLSEAGIGIPETDWQVGGGRKGLHTEWLGHLLSELQFVQRAYPGLEW
jgi:ring-1,2-phenylacetyl-CoA epoxidase subunit PaaC